MESKKKRTFRGIAAVVVLAAAVLMGGCSYSGGTPDISAYADEEIVVEGLTDETFTVTPQELAGLKCVRQSAEGNSEKAGTVQAYGPTLDTFLAEYDASTDDFSSIKFYAKDDYTVTLGPVTWESHDIILSVAAGKEPLEEYQQPLRIVIPDEDSGKWVRMVTKISFTRKEDSAK